MQRGLKTTVALWIATFEEQPNYHSKSYTTAQSSARRSKPSDRCPHCRLLRHSHHYNMPLNFAKGPHAPSKRKSENKQSSAPNKKAKRSTSSNGVPLYKDSTN